jgi:hypothetical protein
VTIRHLLFIAAVLLLCANGATAARYQRCKDGKTLVWNNLRGVAQDVTWSGLRDLNGYATGEGTLSWYRLGTFVNSYTGKMVSGKFEGPVIRQQGNTRLQANFANGERVGGWSEPGSIPTAAPTATTTTTPKPTVEQAEIPEETPAEVPYTTPSPIPAPRSSTVSSPAFSPSPRPTPTPRSSPSPTPTATLNPSPSPTPTTPPASPSPIPTTRSISTSMGMPTLQPTATPTAGRSLSPALGQQPDQLPSSAFEDQGRSLELRRSPAASSKAEESPSPETPPSPRLAPSGPGSGGSRKIDPVAKRRLIAEFKQQIDFVLGQVRDATNNFKEVDRLDQARELPPAVSSHVTLLANSARDFRARLGYEVTFYECLSEIQAVDSLVVLDESTRDLAAKDAVAARKSLTLFRARYSEPTAEAQKPLWHYLISLNSLLDRLKDEAEAHLKIARPLESEGKKADALREYREINRLYPNKVTTERIRLLESQTH